MAKNNLDPVPPPAENHASDVMVERGERRITPQSFRDAQAADGRLALAEYRMREVQVREQMVRLRALRMANQKHGTKPKSGERLAKKYQDDSRKGGGSNTQRHAGPQRASKPRPTGPKAHNFREERRRDGTYSANPK
jgi:hypothetical protein